MGLIRRKVPRHFVQIHPDNVATNDWVILLEAGTIVGRPAERLRVAAATLEKKIVTRRNIFLRKTHYLVLPGYDPRIHALYFCPQLYKLELEQQARSLGGRGNRSTARPLGAQRGRGKAPAVRTAGTSAQRACGRQHRQDKPRQSGGRGPGAEHRGVGQRRLDDVTRIDDVSFAISAAPTLFPNCGSHPCSHPARSAYMTSLA